MKTTKITIRNLFGIKETTLDGRSVEITGPKGSGKTSVLDAIRYALTNRSDRDYIIHKGADEGEIIIETDTGLTIDRKTRAKVDDAEGSIEVVINTIDGLTVTDGSGTTKIKGDRVETENLYVNAANISGTLTANQINLTGSITWGDLASDAQNQVTNAQNLASSAYGTAVSAQTSANTANSQISAWTYPGSTMINGQMLMTGTVMASKLLGGSVGLLASDQTVVGSLDIAYTTTGVGLGMTSNYGGMRLKAAGGNVYVESGYGPYVQLGQGAGIGKAVCQLGGGPLVLSADSFGSSLPNSGVYGQIFFLLG